MAEVKRKKGESFESLLRRFGKRIQQSGKQLEARKNRFHAKDENKNKMKRSALRRLEIKENRDYLAKVGRLPEDPRARFRK